MNLDRLIVPFEIKSVDDASRSIEGYGSVFDVVDGGLDVVVKGAFVKSIAERKAAMLWHHNPDMPIGVWDEMREDDRGLFVKGRLAPTAVGSDAHALAKMGAISGLSIGYRAPREQNPVDPKTGIRTLKDVKLYEVSLVTFPMNEAARVTAVKADGDLITEREFERWLRREGGFTEAQAKTIIAKGYRQVRREAMPSEDASELLDAIHRFGRYAGDQRHGTAGRQEGA
jgi:HK97 family phage prohead protease